MDENELSPPAEGEVAELVNWLREEAAEQSPGDSDALPSDVRGCLAAAAARLTRTAELLERHAAPVPVPVAERPWQRQGWCDKEGRFWAEHISRSGVASWRFAAASDLGGWAFRCLPANALPLPALENEK